LHAEPFAPELQLILAAGEGILAFISTSNGGYTWSLDTRLNVDIRGAYAFHDGSAIVVGGTCQAGAIDSELEWYCVRQCDIFKWNAISVNFGPESP
jgi:hypothetical protein